MAEATKRSMKKDDDEHNKNSEMDFYASRIFISYTHTHIKELEVSAEDDSIDADSGCAFLLPPVIMGHFILALIRLAQGSWSTAMHKHHRL